MFDDREETDYFARIFTPYLELGFKRGIENALLSGKFKVEDIFTIGVQATLRQRAYEHAAKAVGTTKDKLTAVLQKAIEDGQGIEEVAQAIRDTFGMMGKVRPRLIARTELTGTINGGSYHALTKEGYQQKTWSTVVDGRERPTHAAANGQTVGIHQPFIVGGSACQHPGDPNLPVSELANCRCVMVGAGLPEDRIRAIGVAFLRIHGSLENKFVISLRKAFLAQRDRVLSRL